MTVGAFREFLADKTSCTYQQMRSNTCFTNLVDLTGQRLHFLFKKFLEIYDDLIDNVESRISEQIVELTKTFLKTDYVKSDSFKNYITYFLDSVIKSYVPEFENLEYKIHKSNEEIVVLMPLKVLNLEQFDIDLQDIDFTRWSDTVVDIAEGIKETLVTIQNLFKIDLEKLQQKYQISPNSCRNQQGYDRISTAVCKRKCDWLKQTCRSASVRQFFPDKNTPCAYEENYRGKIIGALR